LSSLHPLLLLDHLSLDADQLRPLLDLLPTGPALIARPDPLPGLARPIKLGPLPHSDAMSLFALTCVLPLDDHTRPALDGICTLLNDVPLAVVRTAEVVRQMNLTLEQTCQRLSAAPLATGDITVGVSRAGMIQSVLTPLERQVALSPIWILDRRAGLYRSAQRDIPGATIISKRWSAACQQPARSRSESARFRAKPATKTRSEIGC
jgi:hypothetical protein